eukprot:364707-Chlamydomonas_euryale.AAC.12
MNGRDSDAKILLHRIITLTVRHAIGIPGNVSFRLPRERYAGLKSWPHSETQWASSTAKLSSVPASAASKRDACS